MTIDPDVYSDIKTEFPDQDDEAIFKGLVIAFHRYEELLAENHRLRDENEELASCLKDAMTSMKRMEKEKDSAERYCDNLRTRYQKLCDKQETGEPEVIVEEKVVVHEDNSTIDALREKVNALKERVWELQKHEEDHRGLHDRLKDLECRTDDWRRHYHGIVLRNKDRKAIPDIDLTLIDSKEYFRFKREKETFEQDHHLHGPYLVKELPYDR
jgi:hypothetical protein